MESWPATVPYQPLNNSVKIEPFRAPDATDMDGGPQRTRRRVTKNIATLSFRIRMTNAEFTTFSEWVYRDLVDGTLPFTMFIWVNGALSIRQCRFREPYQSDPKDGTHYDVTVSLDVDNGGRAMWWSGLYRYAGEFDVPRYMKLGVSVPQSLALTCTRASARNPIINGTVYSFAANEPCIAEGVLALPEVASTNVLTYSRDFSNAVWDKVRTDVADSAEISAIDGATVKSLTRTSTTEAAYTRQTISGAIGTTKTATFRAKSKSAGGYYGSRVQGSYPDRFDVVVNLSDGSVAYSSAGATHNYTGSFTTPVLDSEGFWVWSITATAVNSAFGTIVHGPTDAAMAGPGWEGATTVLCDAYVDNVQLEDRADATSPMISGATPFIREAETIDFHATGTNDWTFNTDSGAETINGETGDLEIAAGDLTGTEASTYSAEPA